MVHYTIWERRRRSVRTLIFHVVFGGGEAEEAKQHDILASEMGCFGPICRLGEDERWKEGEGGLL